MRELWLMTVAELLSIGELVLAREAARVATETLPDDMVLWALRALVDVDDRDALETAMTIAPDEPIVWLARARAYREGGDSMAAEAAASMAVVRGLPRLEVDMIVFAGSR